MMRRRLLTTIAGLLSVAASSSATAASLADAQRAEIIHAVDAGAPQIGDAALKIWGFAEVGYQETKSTAVLQGQLKDAGFDLTTGVAGEPTAFIARFRNGAGPVVAILAEFDALPGVTLSNMSAKFRFRGTSAHAAAAPWRGRSALDAVEIFDVSANFMREHVPDRTRIHYVITSGGGAPNVVPDFAEVFYYTRSVDPKVVIDTMERLKRAAQGAALATDTTMEYEQVGGVYSLLPHGTLGKGMYGKLLR